MIFATVKKAARYPVASTRFNCASEVGGGGVKGWLESSMRSTECSLHFFEGKTKTSFLEFFLGSQIGKIPVAATLKNQNTEKLFYLFFFCFNNATVYAFTFQNTK